ncbi:Hypothetical protein PENO1_043130 [Penicillium occitanis (nom. inval.)]|nr:Hypothetical protein PENO1_043130 [Penicillium occitanis (nom. inval.)]PCH09671.1 hypothetical protein PENOC_008990 [Penicillium occitanis (nom. inval.)]
MLLKNILFWVSASLVLGVYAAAIDTHSSPPSPITESMDINALTQTPADYLPSSNITSLSHVTHGTSSLSKRYDFKKAPFKCHGLDYGYAAVDSVTAGIKHLTSSSVNKGKPSNSALNCGRSKQPLTIDSFADIASGAQYVVSKCAYWDDGRSKEMVAGEANPGPDWTIVVRKNHC